MSIHACAFDLGWWRVEEEVDFRLVRHGSLVLPFVSLEIKMDIHACVSVCMKRVEAG